jgi:hypothetical protein
VSEYLTVVFELIPCSHPGSLPTFERWDKTHWKRPASITVTDEFALRVGNKKQNRRRASISRGLRSLADAVGRNAEVAENAEKTRGLMVLSVLTVLTVLRALGIQRGIRMPMVMSGRHTEHACYFAERVGEFRGGRRIS